MRIHIYCTWLLSSLVFAACQTTGNQATLIIHNANIWTGNPQQEHAQAIAINDDKILVVGSNEEVMKLRGEKTKTIDAKEKFITPGFIDSHVHLLTGGRSLLSVDLRDAATPDEFSQRIAGFAKKSPPKSWILEGNWDHTLWGGELPKKEWIDPFTQENPVAVFRLDGHMVLANFKALEFAGINKDTPEIAGGEIVRNEDGSPTGILKDNAMNLLLDKIPPMSKAEKEESFRAAMNYFLANGVTSVHDVDSMDSYGTANMLKDRGELAVRIYFAKPIYKWQEYKNVERIENKWLKTGALKGFVDGSLGSHTAAFHDHYTDKPKDKGLFLHSQADLYQWISGADQSGFHLLVHAIGDQAIHDLLNIFERVIGENGPGDRRLRIEHAQHIAPEDIERFAELGVIASMQPYHAIDDGRWAEEYIGPERIKTTYAFKSLLDAKAHIAFGSDWAVAPASPIQGIYAAVTRRTLDDQNPNGWVPEQKITVEQALKAYTIDAAYASFEEKIKGSLEPGKLADFLVLSDDLTKIDPITIRQVEVLQTYVGGKLVFEK